MKNYLIFIFFSCLFILCKNPQGPASWSVVSNGIRFRICTDKTIYQEDEDIRIFLEFNNLAAETKVILVNGQQLQLPERAPLYDINKVIIYAVQNSEISLIFVLIPIPSNMFNDVPALLKLQPGQRYRESGVINLGGWTHKELYEHDPFTHLEPGKYKLQAFYTWDELPNPTQERVNQLEQLGAPLWNGYLESNEITIRIISKN